MEIKLIICFSCVIPTINFQRLKILLVTLLFFIVEYIFLKQFVKLLNYLLTYLLTFPMRPHWLVPITGLLQDVCILYWSLKASAPRPWNFLNVPTTFDPFLPKQQFSNRKYLMLWNKALIWLEVSFSQHIQRYSETSVWFVHVTNCYWFGGRNLR